MEEIWKDIPDYEGIYQASSLGRIRTTPDKTTYTELRGVRHWKTRIMKGKGNNKHTGARVGLWKNGECKDWLVARLVAITFLGQPSGDKNTVNHINGNRLDNRVENLEWLSLADNIRHAFRTGLHSQNIRVVLRRGDYQQEFISKGEASRFLGKSTGYVSSCMTNNYKIYDKDKNEWECIILGHNKDVLAERRKRI